MSKRRRKRKASGKAGAGDREELSRQSVDALMRAALADPLSAHEPLRLDDAGVPMRGGGRRADEALGAVWESEAETRALRERAARLPAVLAEGDLLTGRPPAEVRVLAETVARHVPGAGDRLCLTVARAVLLMGDHEKKVIEAAEKAVSGRRRSIERMRERADRPPAALYDDRPGIKLADALRKEARAATAARPPGSPQYQEGFRAACVAYAKRLERRAAELEAGDHNLVRRWPIRSTPEPASTSSQATPRALEDLQVLQRSLPAGADQQRRYWLRRVMEALTGVGVSDSAAPLLAEPLLDRLPWPADINGLASRLAAAEAQYRQLEQRRERFAPHERTWRTALAKELRQLAQAYSPHGAASAGGQFGTGYDAASSRIARSLTEHAQIADAGCLEGDPRR